MRLTKKRTTMKRKTTRGGYSWREKHRRNRGKGTRKTNK